MTESDSTAFSPGPNATPGVSSGELLGRALEPKPVIGDPQSWQPPSPEALQAHLYGYEVRQYIARGGMGAVYRGMHMSLARPVAIKILPPELRQEDPQYAERFQQEARAMAKLNHPGIVGVYDFGQMADGTLYFIMEFIDGTDVDQMVLAQGRLTTAHAMSITAHVCDALHYAHSQGVIHRDIKPANIMVGYDGRVKVADFGLAKSLRQKDLGLTQSGHVMGTPHFVAPEVLIQGMEVDHRADIYAVGVMLYQMLTGKVPQGVFEMPSLQVAGLDPRYDQIIARAMREDRDQRYATILEMRQALDGILTQPVPQSKTGHQTVPASAVRRPVGPPPPRPSSPSAARRRSKMPVGITVMAACVMLAGWWLQRGGAPEKTQPVPEKAVVAALTTPDKTPELQMPVASAPQTPRPVQSVEPLKITPPPPTQQKPPTLFLGDLTPRKADVGWFSYRVNQYDAHDIRAGRLPIIGGKNCTQFLLAHARSRLEFAIPEGYTFFTATGFGPTTTMGNPADHGSSKKSWKYAVQIDGQTVFESRELNTYPNGEVSIKLPLLRGSKTLTLIIDACGSGNSDHSMWGYPTLHRSAETLPTEPVQPPVISTTQQKLAELEDQARKAWERNSAQLVEAEITALGKSYLANGFPKALSEARSREDQVEIAALEKERDAYIARQVVPPAGEAGIHPTVKALRATYHSTKLRIENSKRPMPITLYEPYFAELRKVIPTARGDELNAVIKRYKELWHEAGFHTVTSPQMPPAIKRRCSGIERLAWLKAGGGSPECDRAVTQAFEFLKSKQNPNGSWGTTLPCLTTSLTLMAYLGRCEDADSPLYGDTVMKALLHLIELSRRSPDGIIASPNSTDHAVEHGAAVATLGETYLTARFGSRSLPGLRDAFEKGINAILKQQLANGGWGKLGSNFTPQDAGGPYVTFWQHMALNQARRTGLRFAGLKEALNRVENYWGTIRTKDGNFGTQRGDGRRDPWLLTSMVLHARTPLPDLHPHWSRSGKTFMANFIRFEPPKWDRG
ncbi:MAG: protein kinase, partial [Prosthecobacter sp.]